MKITLKNSPFWILKAMKGVWVKSLFVHQKEINVTPLDGLNSLERSKPITTCLCTFLKLLRRMH